MWAAAAAQIEKCTTILLCFCFAFALLLLCFAFALLTHIFICLLHTHIFIRLLLYRHIFICPLLFIENSWAKDAIASMIPCPMKAQISKSKPGRIFTDQQMQARLQQGTNATRHKLCAAVNGRKPAMRVPEQVCTPRSCPLLFIENSLANVQ